MLVLSRQRDETIMIGDEIEITVVDIRGDKVRLGITAPTRIAVHRKEVYDAIRQENEQAARISLGGGVGADLSSLHQTIAPGPSRTRIAGSTGPTAGSLGAIRSRAAGLAARASPTPSPSNPTGEAGRKTA
jgi:carbon storage regulator